MDSLYQIPLLAQDMRHEECILQIANSLQLLADVADDVFSRIHRRIDRNASETRSILSRVSVCKAKVDKLTDTNKATRMFSEAKYPAMNCFADYASIFEKDENYPTLKRVETEISNKQAVPDDRISDKLEFYHVRTATSNLYRWIIANVPNSGLGQVPNYVEYATALLQFNRKRFPYGSNSLENESQDYKVQISSRADKKPELEEAPFSIINKDQAAKKASDPYLYSPGMGEAPEMDMPMDLPYLSGVAEDMQFSLEDGPTIAPSASFISTTEDDCKSVENVVPISAPTVEMKQPVIEKKEVAIKPPETSAPVPPPLPPPIAPLLDIAPKITEKESSEPDSAFVIQANNRNKLSKTESPNTPVAVDNRASLMEAIRNAGGSGKAKLRSTATTKTEEKSTSVSGSGDLMADLHAKLSMRRKGISGDRAKTADSSILDVISAMIPPPAQTTNAEASSAEDDWD